MEELPVETVPDNFKSPTLRRWRVIEVALQNGGRSRHVLGHDVANGAGRASSAISQFDLENMVVITHSGNQYKLIGVPGWARSVEHVWSSWCRVNGVISEQDVTHEYFSVDKFFHGGERDAD